MSAINGIVVTLTGTCQRRMNTVSDENHYNPWSVPLCVWADLTYSQSYGKTTNVHQSYTNPLVTVLKETCMVLRMLRGNMFPSGNMVPPLVWGMISRMITESQLSGYVLEVHAHVTYITPQWHQYDCTVAYHKLYNRPASPLSRLCSSSCSSPLLNKNKSAVEDSL
jgi:hypothetical protein